MLVPRFYPILDTAVSRRYGVEPVEAARRILSGGAKILQFRHKAFFSRETFAEVEEIAGLCREAGALFVINDRVDIAALVGAGLHLGQEDLKPEQARSVLGSGAIIGFSTHNESQLRAAMDQPADYLAIGPIFSTSTKENPDPVIGLDELRRLRGWTNRPLVAIGGITRSNARHVFDAGADSVAVISDLFPEKGALSERVEEWLAV
jgi:thiamine-phosphate pyrophosphorylase